MYHNYISNLHSKTRFFCHLWPRMMPQMRPCYHHQVARLFTFQTWNVDIGRQQNSVSFWFLSKKEQTVVENQVSLQSL